MQVRVGPPQMVIFADDQVLVSSPDARIDPASQQGFFVADTRLASRYELTLSGLRPILVTSSEVEAFSARFEFVNPPIPTIDGEIPESSLHVRLDRTIGTGIHEDYDVTSYAQVPVTIDLEIRLESDYADIFEVRSGRPFRRGRRETNWDQDQEQLVSKYQNSDFVRSLRFTIVDSGTEPEYADGQIFFRVTLQPRDTWHSCLFWEPVIGGHMPSQPEHGCSALVGDTAHDERLRQWSQQVTELTTSDPEVNRAVQQAVHDLGALRIRRHDPDVTGVAAENTQDLNAGRECEAERLVPAAGVPWYVSLFGRDALVVAHQAMAISPVFSLAAIEALSLSQGTEFDDSRDMQPGKIEHEVRFGELAYFDLIPQRPYYGTHDATALYVWGIGRLWQWSGAVGVMERLRPSVEAALWWIDHDGDIDGDGLQEYRTRAGERGFYNQGWKDAGDAIMHANGDLAPLPIALCELQGYVVAAKRAWARVLEEAFGDEVGSATLIAEADRLAVAIEERFWWEQEGTYFLGLDGHKEPIRTVASNPGHLLWSEAIRSDRAERVAHRLLAPDMWSGWGIRTLSSSHLSYNPFLYQRGSVWPHDNSVIAAGLLAYGQDDAAWHVMRGLLDAAAAFDHSRLPEVFAGVERSVGSFPVQYLGANVPQAWAAGSVVQMISCLAGLRPDASRRVLNVDHHLPDWLTHLMVRGLRVGDARVDVMLSDAGVEVLAKHGTLDVRSRHRVTFNKS